MPPHTPPFLVRRSIIDTFMVFPRSSWEFQAGKTAKGVYWLKKKQTTKTFKRLSFSLSVTLVKYPNERGSSGTSAPVEAITFECQKIILAVIFSNIRAAAKAMNGHGGKGNDLLLLPMTVHNSIFNIFSFKSLRSLLMYLAYLIYVFWNLLLLLFVFSFVIQQHVMWQLMWNLLYYFPAIWCPCIIAPNAL